MLQRPENPLSHVIIAKKWGLKKQKYPLHLEKQIWPQGLFGNYTVKKYKN